MLAIATTLVSLGTDPSKACPVPCGPGDVAATAFAKSFADNSALASEVQAAGAEGKMSKDTAGNGNLTSAKTAVAAAFIEADAKGTVRAGEIVQDEPDVAKDLIAAINVKAIVPVPKGVKAKVTGVEALPQGAKANENGIVGIQIGVPESQPSWGSMKDATPEPASGTVGGSKAIPTDELTTPKPDIDASAMASIPDHAGKPLIRNQKEILTIEDRQEELATDKAAKDHGVVVKAGKSEKIEKTDKAARPTESAVGLGAQAATGMPIMVLQQDGQLLRMIAMPDENGIPSIASTGMKPRIGMTAVADSNIGKKHRGPGKPDAGEMKAQGFCLPGDSASQKPGTDAQKNTMSAAATTAGGDSKELSAAAMNAATVPKHPDGLVSIAASATGTGVAAVPAPTIGTQPPVGSHAQTMQSGTGMQSGASAIEVGLPIDAAHRTLTATATSLEVGVANGSHGWLKIRAEMGDGGVVNASLSTASSSGQESLHRELPSLAAYLQNEHVAVNAVVVQPVAVAAADPRGFGGGLTGDGRGQQQQSGRQGGDNHQDAANTAMNRMENRVPYNGLSGMVSSEQLPLMPYARGGNWLSVRA